MADTGYLEFSYDEAEVNEITSYLTSTQNRLNEYNLSSLISELQNCRGWSRVVNSSGVDYIGQLNKYKNSGTDYASAIEKERTRISDTLAALKTFDGEVVTVETNGWATLAMGVLNFTEGFLTGFEQVLDGLMTGAAVLAGWVGLEGASEWLTNAVEYEIVGSAFDYAFENWEWMKNIEQHAAWAHDDAAADTWKGFGTVASYIAMAAMGGSALGKGFNVLGKTIKLAGGAWTGPASIVADMVMTGVGTLGAETQKELQAQEVNDINAAAWAAMDDVVLSTVIAGTAGAAFEYGPGLIKKGYQSAKAFFSEAAEEGAQAVTRTAAGEAAEEYTQLAFKYGDQTIDMTESQFKEFAQRSGMTPEEAIQDLMDKGVDIKSQKWHTAADGSLVGDPVQQGVGDAFQNASKGADVPGGKAPDIKPEAPDIKPEAPDIKPNNDVTDMVPYKGDTPPTSPSALKPDDVVYVRPDGAVEAVTNKGLGEIIEDGSESTALAIVNKGAGEAGQGLMRQG
ncbi:MAG: hypothetical protein Q4C49_13970, partial [Bacillota bacterium]|nr:hypothetical protein [Bacillota bacterium]